jgi:hypothetical protein
VHKHRSFKTQIAGRISRRKDVNLPGLYNLSTNPLDPGCGHELIVAFEFAAAAE